MISPLFWIELVRSLIRIGRAQGRLVPLPGENVEELEVEAFRKLQVLTSRQVRTDFEDRLKPEMLDVDFAGRRRSIPVHPVRGVTSGNQVTVRWAVNKMETRLTIRCSPVMRALGVVVFLMGTAFAGVGAFTVKKSFGAWIAAAPSLSFHSLFDAFWSLSELLTTVVGVVFLAVGTIFALVGLMFVAFNPSVLIFDIAEQAFWLGKRRGVQSRPLSDLFGLQIIQARNRDQESPRYQLNLLLDDPNRPRFNICDHPDLSAIDELAARLSALTGAPILRHLPSQS